MASEEKEIEPVATNRVADLPNFRILCSKDGANSQDEPFGLLYRSSRPDFLDDSSILQFSKLGIRSVIDFRSQKEYAKADGDKLLDSISSLYVVKIPHKKAYKPAEAVNCKLITSKSGTKTKKVEKIRTENEAVVTSSPTNFPVSQQNESESPSKRNCHSNGNAPGRIKHYLINFFTGKYIWTVFRRAPWYLQLYSLFWLLIDVILNTNYRYFVQTFATYMLNPVGIIGQYKDIVDLSQRSICAALKLLTDPDNIPALINCAHGKDRTGIVTALIMSCLGRSKEEIIKEYSRSAEGLQSVLERIHKEIVIQYHMSEEFITANKETMSGLLDYITQQYGSVSNYLESIGFSGKEQEQLRRNLISTDC